MCRTAMSTKITGDYQVYWGESHDNTYQFSTASPIEEVLQRAASHLDFYAAAYYTACAEAFEEGGHQAEKAATKKLILEGWTSLEKGTYLIQETVVLIMPTTDFGLIGKGFKT